MRINIQITGNAQARDKIAALAQRMRDLRPAYTRAGVVVLTAAQGRIRANGPGWAPTVENQRGSSLQRTGALFRSLTENEEGNVSQDIPNGIRVGTNLRTPDGRYSIGMLMQNGRAAIVAKPGKALRFVVNGKVVYAKSVKAAPPRPFLFIDQQTAEKVVNVFTQRVRGDI